ncbi:uncharacterized protein LOC127833939 [Dreissena polymorpha]|uniref:Uncharacterized protein n=1 Tax=Dreissena polymorpha TaxID=45954 RepID=A0A9D4G0E2_DREPO|nr:uncharacterized protein LOC127833939 [Dreissena polymorpha]KAH3806383.1 hypothetical protein DPMN_134704 [Dreissena polymorpha]
MQNDLLPSARAKPDKLSLELYNQLIKKLRGQCRESMPVTQCAFLNKSVDSTNIQSMPLTERVCLNKSVDSTNIHSVVSAQNPKTRKRHSSGEVVRAKPDVSVIKLSLNNVGKKVTGTCNDLKVLECDSATNYEEECVSQISCSIPETKHASLFSQHEDDNNSITDEFESHASRCMKNKSRTGICSLKKRKSKCVNEVSCEQHCAEAQNETVVGIETGKDNKGGGNAPSSKNRSLKCFGTVKQINKNSHMSESKICSESENRKPSNSKKRANLQENVNNNYITNKRIKLSCVVNKANLHTETKQSEHDSITMIHVETKEHTNTNGLMLRQTAHSHKPRPQDRSGFMPLDDSGTWVDGISSSKDRNSANHTIDVSGALESIMPLNAVTEIQYSFNRKAKLAIDKEKGLLNRRMATSSIWESLNAQYQ